MMERRNEAADVHLLVAAEYLLVVAARLPCARPWPCDVPSLF
jgi:hypothetical protein